MEHTDTTTLSDWTNAAVRSETKKNTVVPEATFAVLHDQGTELHIA